MMRLFVAIVLPENVRRGLEGLCHGLHGAHWTPPDNLHLTLRFVGEVDDGTAEDIDGALTTVHAPAFDLRCQGIGHFATGRQVRVVWAGLERSEALIFLRDKIESTVVRAGLEPEQRKFKPHIALAHFKKPPGAHLASYLETHGGFASEPFAVDSFTLFRSHLRREGAYHETLAEYPLVAFG
jgi:2'-5' RNA ligase